MLPCVGCAAESTAQLPEAQQTATATAAQQTEAVTQTPEPTTEPTPTPAPTPTPSPTLEPVTDEMLDSGRFDAYFDDAVFVGDSITESLRNYCIAQQRDDEDFMGNAQFLAAVSMSVRMASSDSRTLLQYRGNAVSVTEGLLKMGAGQVFIMLGVNDYAGKYPDATLAYFDTLIDAIQEKCERIEIVIQSVTPVTKRFCQERRITIEEWNGFNVLLEQLCEEKGVQFLSFAELLMDAEGYLADDMTGDGMFHLTPAANAVWIRALRQFAAEQYALSGAYPPEPTDDMADAAPAA
jgi:lysophospholipase L1-like esterase